MNNFIIIDNHVFYGLHQFKIKAKYKNCIEFAFFVMVKRGRKPFL